jgi:hypothetical protein
MSLEVYILGAGCSVEAGYPLAAGMRDKLEEFGRTIAIDSPIVSEWCTYTAGLMRESNAQTLDELTEGLINRTRQIPNATGVQRHSEFVFPVIRKAKASISAYFFSLEPKAIIKGLQPYKDFIDEILPMKDGTSLLTKSNKRVLSFNYDRLFEMSFANRFLRYDEHDMFTLCGPNYLNSGFTLSNGRMQIQSDRFTFLKMHGSVGHIARPLLGNNGSEVEFFLNPLNISFQGKSWDQIVGIPSRDKKITPIDSLIHFPIEKAAFLEQVVGKELTSYDRRTYISDIWNAAENIMMSAHNVYLIGFSGKGKDSGYLEKLLKISKNLNSITIYDPDAKNIAIRVKRMRPDLRGRIYSESCNFWT